MHRQHRYLVSLACCPNKTNKQKKVTQILAQVNSSEFVYLRKQERILPHINRPALISTCPTYLATPHQPVTSVPQHRYYWLALYSILGLVSAVGLKGVYVTLYLAQRERGM